jgi:hypothetical protein
MNAQDISAGLMEAAVVANDNENGILGLIRELSQSVTPAVGPALQVRVSALIHYVAGQPLAVNGDLVRCAHHRGGRVAKRSATSSPNW